MLKAIFAKHIRAGDGILLPGGEKIVVKKAEISGGNVRLMSSHPVVELEEYDIVGLGHRPWPEGKTDQVMGWAITDALEAFRRSTPSPERLKLMVKLREAIETYELGRPEEKSLELVYSPTNGCGVVYDGGDAVYIVEVEKMYKPESAAGVHIAMFMQGPGDHRTIPAGEFPFRDAYDRMSREHEEKRAALDASVSGPGFNSDGWH